MKIANYNRGYQPWCDCVVHGTIYVSSDEAKKIFKQNRDNPYIDVELPLFSLGVTATYKLAGKLPKYKDQNYQFKII